MTPDDYPHLHIELGFAFTDYVCRHFDSPLLEPLTDETLVTFQTDDLDFNAYELRSVQKSRARDDVPDRPVAIVYVPVPNPPSVVDVDWSNAKVLARLVIIPEPAKVQTTV